ncbi:MAG: GNAT family N-acetyltransferase [Pyrinomonadaceae bacterium]|nr:GNAT family N-acetyltransferase [Pyrinomonadaceae bacterium]
MSQDSEVTVIPFDERFAGDFARLNYEWIERYFRVEPHDSELLDDPKGQIVATGGEVFFAVIDEACVGTVAMVPHGDSIFELTKMAVSPAHHGRGIANRLMTACVGHARDKGASTIFLETNSVLAPAIALYRKFGFVDTPLDPGSQYFRADVRMELALSGGNM